MSKKVTLTLRDEINCNIRGLDPKHRDLLFEKWAIRVHNAHFFPLVKQGKWDGKVNFFKMNGNTFINLLDEIVPWIYETGYEIDVIDNRTPHSKSPELIDADVFAEYGKILRWYQVEAVNKAIQESHGLLVLATGAGKSLINAAIVHAYSPLRSMTIVPNTDLVTQTVKTFKSVGLDAGRFYSKKKEVDKQHIVSTWQSLKNHRHILKDVDVIIVDEVHGAKSTILNELLIEGYGPKIPYRFGLTGTLPKPKSDLITLKNSLGTEIYTLKAKQLMDEGFLSRLLIHIKQMQDAPDHLIKKPKYTKGDTEAVEAAWKREKQFLVTNTQRIKNMADSINEIMADDESKNTLVLIDSVDAGKALAKLLNKKFIYGKTDTKDRTAEYDDFEGAEGKLLIATFGIAKAGIDITKVHNVVLIDAGKAFTKVIQSVGRGLRTDEHKKHVDIFDICSNSYYSNMHMKERMKYYDDAEYHYTSDKIFNGLWI